MKHFICDRLNMIVCWPFVCVSLFLVHSFICCRCRDHSIYLFFVYHMLICTCTQSASLIIYGLMNGFDTLLCMKRRPIGLFFILIALAYIHIYIPCTAHTHQAQNVHLLNSTNRSWYSPTTDNFRNK